MNKFILGMVIAGIGFAFLFLTYPRVDIFISNLFYNDVEGFYLNKRYEIFGYLHDSVHYITIAIIALSVICLLISFALKKEFVGLTKKKLAFIMLALLIGPGLIVNSLFKDNWGRARPHQTIEFGGNKEFSPPFIISDQCEKNCSFVSGDPSVGFFLISFALIFANRRKTFMVFSLSLGSILGATRIVQGAHYASDVIFSAIFTILTCYLLYLIMFRKDRE